MKHRSLTHAMFDVHVRLTMALLCSENHAIDRYAQQADSSDMYDNVRFPNDAFLFQACPFNALRQFVLGTSKRQTAQ